MSATREDLFARLESLGIETKTVEHEAAFTVEESRALDKQLEGGHTKNLFVKSKKDEIFLIVTLNDAEIKMNHVHKALGCARLSFGKPELLEQVLAFGPAPSHRLPCSTTQTMPQRSSWTLP